MSKGLSINFGDRKFVVIVKEEGFPLKAGVIRRDE